ncbi:hypothetical protein [Streptomyces melanogenes]|uniref:hypothetical protein n=1 Tax=Streptomyces melanogenes TaxID=67326 RepID=UPI0037893090
MRGTAQARQAAGLREALGEVRRTVAVLAALLRDATMVVRKAVRDIRTTPPPPAAGPPPDPATAALCRVVDDTTADAEAMGALLLEVAAAYLCGIEAAGVLALLFKQIGEPLEHGLAARRYAMSGARRALLRTRFGAPVFR